MNLKTLTRKDVEDLADSILIFRRGQDYLGEGAVAKFRLDGDKTIEAKVAGSGGLYEVEITEKRGELEIDCTCPYDGYVCKHAVAVLLYYLNEREGGTLKDHTQVQSDLTGVGTILSQTLENMDHSQLVELLLRLSDQNDSFRRTLLENITIPAQFVRRQPVNPAAVRRLQSEMSHFFSRVPQYFDDSYESEELDEIDQYFEEIATFNPQDQLELLMHLVEAGNASLDEYGFNAAQLGRALIRFGQAASLLALSPKEKQDHFDWMLDTLDELEIWDYGADPEDLKAGLDALASTPGDYTYLIEQFKEIEDEYAEITDWIADYYLKLGDDQNYLAVRQAHLAKESHFLELAEYWLGKGNEAKYLETLERWLDRLAELKRERQLSLYSSSSSDKGLVLERLAGHYREHGADKDLLRILLAQAEYYQPTLERYRQVKEVAERLERWPGVRKIFLNYIPLSNQKVLAEIYLDEKDWEAALALARQQTGYGQEEIKGLVAAGVQQERPEAAIELYRNLVDFNNSRSNRKYYTVSAHYAAHIKDIYLDILKDPAGWQQYITKIRSDNPRRRALLEEFKSL